MKPNSQSKILYGFIMLALLLLPAESLQAQSCSGVTPGFAVTENLWLDGIFRPGETTLPANQIPAERDSTSWDSLSNPGFGSGHEIFESVDVVGDYLYVAYNAGLQIWDISGGNAEDPERVVVRDGWYPFSCQTSSICGPFLSFPPSSEIDFLVEDISVLAQGSIHYIAMSGRTAVGPSLWQFNTVTEVLSPIYQDVTRLARQVRLVEVGGARGTSTIYALASSGNGLAVYDLTRALEIDPCLEETASDCPGVYVGNVGTISTGRYVDVLQRPSGQILVTVSDGDLTTLGLELWSVNDLSNPSVATRLFAGLENRTFGTAMFNYEGTDYLAALERDGSVNQIKIWDIDGCVGPCSLGVPEYEHPGVPPRVSNQFLTYSTSNGTPFLYYGLFGGFGGPKVEQLLNLTTLGRPGQNITEMTDGGPTYFDTCESANLGYWAWYYPGNQFGLKNFSPRVGKFNPDTNFFYRAAGGVLDVHVWEAGVTPPDPEIATTVSNPDPEGLYWMGDEITFEGAGSSGCNPNGIWTWTAQTPTDITAVTVSEIDNRVTYRFECTGRGGRCADSLVSVFGTNSDPSCDGATTTAASITVKDPTVEITSIDPNAGTFTQCEDVDFTAGLVGRGPTGLNWSVRRDPALDLLQVPQQTLDTTVLEEDLSTASPMFTWNTATASFAGIFSDGFESGDILAWGQSPLLVEDFVIGLDLNRGGPSNTVTVTLSSILGDPEFDSPAIDSSTVDSATFDFTANTLPGTVSEWDWELEDDDGGELCTFGVDINVPCVRLSGQSITHTWVLQAGDRRVKAIAGNCQTATTAEATTTVSVVSTTELVVNSFELDRGQSTEACTIDFDCFSGLMCTCFVDETIYFEVVTEGDPDFLDFDWDGNGSFEDTGNPVTGTEYTNVYPIAIGTTVPRVRARRGAATPAERDLRETLDIQP